MSSGDVVIAPYTGTYYAYVNIYYGKQYKYEIGVKKINLKAPTVSVSAGKSSAKVSWSKVNNYRYEVQYATNSKFQGAKKSKCSRSEDFCYNQIPYFKKEVLRAGSFLCQDRK